MPKRVSHLSRTTRSAKRIKKRRQQETPEQRELRLARTRQYAKFRLSHETPEQREDRLSKSRKQRRNQRRREIDQSKRLHKMQLKLIMDFLKVKREMVGHCRICQASGSQMFDMFTVLVDVVISNEPKSMYELFEKVTALPVKSDDGLSQHLCKICFNSLRASVQLRQQATEAFPKAFMVGKKYQNSLEMIKNAYPSNCILDGNNLTQGCLICANLSEDLVDISSNTWELVDGEPKSLSELYEQSTGLKLPNTDQSLKFFCQNCIKRLRESLQLLSMAKKFHVPVVKATLNCNETNESEVYSVIKIEPTNWEDDIETNEDELETTSIIHQAENGQNEILLRKQMENTENRQEYNCEICNEMFSNQQKLRDHLKTHIVGNLFQCPCCPKRFTSTNEVRQHIPVHRNDNFYVAMEIHKNQPGQHSKSHLNNENDELS